MARAKAQYDTDGSWKYRKHTPESWESLGRRIRSKLRPFFPDKDAEDDPTFGHPADEWANALLIAADGAISLMYWLGRRHTNEELRAEHEDLLKTLNAAATKLGTVSHDLDILFGVDADLHGVRDAILKLIPYIEGGSAKIDQLPRARKMKDVQSRAAAEMALRCLRVMKGEGIKIAATADTYAGRASSAVRILKILGDELGLCLDESVWKRVVGNAKKAAPDLREQ
jgi:hypothetical protein